MPPPPRRPFDPRKARKPATKDQGWDPVAAWYDKLVGETESDHHRHFILPVALRMPAPLPGESVVDVCCGQAALTKPMLDAV
jgi:ubiquinone/menaquinone biosynthesis C-methylase UbiE